MHFSGRPVIFLVLHHFLVLLAKNYIRLNLLRLFQNIVSLFFQGTLHNLSPLHLFVPVYRQRSDSACGGRRDFRGQLRSQAKRQSQHRTSIYAHTVWSSETKFGTVTHIQKRHVFTVDPAPKVRASWQWWHQRPQIVGILYTPARYVT